MPLQTSAQASIPAVDLHCLNIYGEIHNDDIADSNISAVSNSSSEILAIINTDNSEPSANVTCTVSNPNSYQEKIQIQVSADGLAVSAPSSITLWPNGEESFNITLLADQSMTLGNRVLNVTATVVEANGAPPPNIAEDYVEGIVWIVNDEFLISSSIEITEIGPYKSTTDFYTMENGTEYPVLYLKESFHFDAIMTGWDGNPIANKCLNIYVDPEENTLPIATINTSENGTIEWFSGDPSQNPSLKGVETTGGKLEGFRTVRLAYEPNGGSPYMCDWDDSGNHTSSYADIDVFVRSKTDLQVKESWRLIGENSVNHGEVVTGEVLLMRERLALSIENETIRFQFYYTSDGMNWTFDHEEFYLTNEQGVAGFQWPAKYVDHENCSNSSCHLDWRISAYHIGSLHFVPARYNITFDVTVLQPVIDSDGDGVEDDEDAFPDDPGETHDDDGDGVGNNTDEFPQDPDEQYDSDEDGVGDNSDAFPDNADETHDDDGDGVGNNTDEFPQDPDEQYDSDGDGVGNNADDFPDNKYASNWSTIYAAVGTMIVLLIVAGVMISRMKKDDELPNVPASNDIEQLEKQIQELEQQKSQMIMEQDPTELMFED